MPIKVACQCGASFNAKDELAGKAVRCPKCKQPLQIPAPAPAPAPANDALSDLFDEAGIEAKTGPTCPRCGAELKPNAVLCVGCGLHLQTGEQAEGAKVYSTAGGHEAATETLLTRAEKQIEVDKEDDRKNRSSGQPFYVYLFGLFALAAFATMMFVLPSRGLAFFITGIGVIVFASMMSSYYGLRIWIIAFQESVGQGFLQLVPFYSLYYLITRWAKCGPWFMKQLGTIPIALLGGGLMGIGFAMGFDPPKDESLLPTPRLEAVREVALIDDSTPASYRFRESQTELHG